MSQASEPRGSPESRVYLLTLWREDPDGPWRAALRPAGTEARLGFADLEHLAAYLLRLDEEGREDGPESRSAR